MVDKQGVAHRPHVYGHHENNFEPFRDQHYTKYEDPGTYHKRQHFIHGKGGGGSPSNNLIYGGQSMPSRLDQNDLTPRYKHNFLESRITRPETYPSGGFLYGKEDTLSTNRPRFTSYFGDRSSAEKRKKAAQKLEKDRDIERQKIEKEARHKERTEEKRRDLEMLKNYQPWGKPGGGAPNRTSLYDNGRTKEVERFHYDDEQILPLGRPGGGAPNRTESGRVKAALKADPEIQLQTKKEGKNHHLLAEKLHLRENAKYYNPENYRTELEKLAEESRVRRSRAKEIDMKREMETLQYNPYGRPGGGAPIRDSEGHVKASLALQLSNDIHQLRDIENRHTHAFNELNSERPKEFDIDLFRKGNVKQTAVNTNYQDDHPHMILGKENLGGAGAPRRDKDGNLLLGIPQSLIKQKDGSYATHDRTKKVHDDPEVENILNFHPWGKPGAGAPIRDDQGNIKTHVAGKVQEGKMELTREGKEHQKEYLEMLRGMAAENESLKEKEKKDRLEESQPVATWLRKGKVGQPKYDPVTHEIIADPYVTSDITRTKMHIRTQKGDQAKEYLHDLNRQEKYRRQLQEDERRQERERSAEHAKTMENFWGREGYGAPQNDNRRKKHELQPSNIGMNYRGV